MGDTPAKNFDPRTSTDNDFVQRGGIVNISRVYRDSGLTFGQSTHPSHKKTELVDLHKSGTMIKSGCEKLGDLDAVHFAEVNAEREGMVEVEIYAAGVSCKDVVVTLGTTPGDENALGHEAAGVVTKVMQGVSGPSVGDHVVVFDKGCFANRVHTSPLVSTAFPIR
jgi:hypothetical protein